MISKRGRIDMKRSRRVTAVLSAILIAACLSGCLGFPGSVSGGSGTGATQAQAAEQNTVTDPDAAKWVDSDIWQVAMAHLDTELKDDFYLAVNSDWISSNRLPDGYASYDTMTECKLEMDQKLVELLKGTEISGDPAVAHDQELVRRYYRMWMNWDQRNDLGVEPLRELLEPLMNVSTLDELTAYLSRPQTVISATELCRCEASIPDHCVRIYFHLMYAPLLNSFCIRSLRIHPGIHPVNLNSGVAFLYSIQVKRSSRFVCQVQLFQAFQFI